MTELYRLGASIDGDCRSGGLRGAPVAICRTQPGIGRAYRAAGRAIDAGAALREAVKPDAVLPEA